MIVPPGLPGVAFGTRHDGDARSDDLAREAFSRELDISAQWATVKQEHGRVVAFAEHAGDHGIADALITDAPGLPIAIATADCVPVVLIGLRTRAVVHAGWRGVASGVVEEATKAINQRRDAVTRAVIGPHIGSCCYEVGEEVVEAIGGFATRTRAGTTSVDLAQAIRSQLREVPVTDVGVCTHDAPDMASYRLDGTSQRQVTVAWIPRD